MYIKSPTHHIKTRHAPIHIFQPKSHLLPYLTPQPTHSQPQGTYSLLTPPQTTPPTFSSDAHACPLLLILEPTQHKPIQPCSIITPPKLHAPDKGKTQGKEAKAATERAFGITQASRRRKQQLARVKPWVWVPWYHHIQALHPDSRHKIMVYINTPRQSRQDYATRAFLASFGTL